MIVVWHMPLWRCMTSNAQHTLGIWGLGGFLGVTEIFSEFYCKKINQSRWGRRNPSAYVVVGTPITFRLFLERTSKSSFCRFFTQKMRIWKKKSFYLPLPPPTKNFQSKNCVDSSRNAPCTAKTLILLKMHFRLLILPFFTLKMRISKNLFIFLFPHLLTTHKPKIVMIHEEMHPVLRKHWFC